MTDDSELVTLLRQAHEQQPVTPLNLGQLLSEHVRRRSWFNRHGWTATAAAATCVTIVAVCAATLTQHHTQPTAAGLGDRTHIPTGRRATTFHGVQLFVPASWPTNDYNRCGYPSGSMVEVADESPEGFVGCTGQPNPNFTTVSFSHLLGPTASDISIAHNPISISGQPALEGETRQANGQITKVITIPSEDTEIKIQSRDATLVEEIAHSAQIMSTDDNGCPARTDFVTVAAGGFQPSASSYGAVCRYIQNRLVRSDPLTGDPLAGLLATVDELHQYAQPTQPCRTGDLEQGFLVRVLNSDQSVTDYAVKLGACQVSVTNGNARRAISQALLQELVSLQGYNGDIPNLAS